MVGCMYDMYVCMYVGLFRVVENRDVKDLVQVTRKKAVPNQLRLHFETPSVGGSTVDDRLVRVREREGAMMMR